jgi:hypothetical protein
VQPAPGNKKSKTDQRPSKAKQASTLENHGKSPSTEGMMMHGQPKTTTNRQYQEKPSMHKRGSSSSWFVDREKKKVVISQSSQLPSEAEDEQHRTGATQYPARPRKTSDDKKNKKARAAFSPGQQEVLTGN